MFLTLRKRKAVYKNQSPFHYLSDVYFSIIFSATLIPSTAALVMPPAYPAPSPAGYIFEKVQDDKSSFLKILTGEEVRQ